MFSRASDASKLALYWLCQQLQRWDFEMIDCQVSSPHLLSLGAHEIAREPFLKRIAVAVEMAAATRSWRFDADVPNAARHGPPTCRNHYACSSAPNLPLLTRPAPLRAVPSSP